MGNLSEIAGAERRAVTLAVPAYWAEHRFQGRAVLPAVEAMQLLARKARQFRSNLDIARMRQASFSKFLEIPADVRELPVFCDLAEQPDGSVRAALVTRMKTGSAGFTRTKEHASAVFLPASSAVAPAPEPPLDLVAALQGVCFPVAAERIYAELVPFGPAYRNIRQPVQVTEEGALAVIQAPEFDEIAPFDEPLGSPFVLDAAFHAACVWGQRYAGIVAFPVGIDQRLIYLPARAGERYYCRVIPVQIQQDSLVFDLWILDSDGRMREATLGVRMRDASGGRLKPPQWVTAGRGNERLARLAQCCEAVSLIELQTLMPFAHQCLSAHELQRYDKMGAKRRRSYLGARLACKRLFRQIAGDDRITLAADITTVGPDSVKPCIPRHPGTRPCACSVSHDRRFAVAVAGPASQPIGVDVEIISPRVLKSQHLFMHPAEQDHVRCSELGAIQAALRIWSIKESVAKCLDICLADAWQQTEVLDIGLLQSRLRVRSGKTAAAVHESVNEHLFTLICGWE